jgi:hypothetical protein
MKRIYLRPQTEAINISVSVTLCASAIPQFGSTEATSGAGLAPKRVN